MAQLSLVIPSVEAGDLAEDVRALIDEIFGSLEPAERSYSGECRPSLDVLETDEALEVTVDVAGVPGKALRVLFRSGVLLIAGLKLPGRPLWGAGVEERSFHLVEREFGRFARAVRVSGAFDIAKAEARLADGELRIVLPRLFERRGAAHRIPVTGPAPQP
jgi:HSP20 family protein